MRKIALLLLTIGSVFAAAAAEPQIVPLWNGVAPGWNKPAYAEEQSVSSDGTLDIRNVVDPTLAIYLPPADKNVGVGMVVIPGGGFTNLAYGKEGERIAEWLNAQGISAFVLKYRVAHTDGAPSADPRALQRLRNAAIPLGAADAAQAMRLVRQRAAEWGLTRIGAIGFSAGGYLTAALALDKDAAVRPDFAVPVYPAAPAEIDVPAGAPPLFIVQADDDRIDTVGSIRLYQAWHGAHVPVEMHLYVHGNHGFALRRNGIPTDTWNQRLIEWMGEMGFLAKAQ
jgi:acetyl esterase/lipase